MLPGKAFWGDTVLDADFQASRKKRLRSYEFIFLACALTAILIAVILSTASVILAERFGFWGDVAKNGFHLDDERNLPTFLNFSLLGANAFLGAIVAWFQFQSGVRWRFHWVGASAVSMFMAFDEAARVHEKLIGPFRRLLELDGLFYFAWVIPYTALVVFLCVVYAKFARALPRRFLVFFAAGAATYVAGAIGFEMIGGLIRSENASPDTLAYIVTTTIEETLEMIGAALTATALIHLLNADRPEFRRYVYGSPA